MLKQLNPFINLLIIIIGLNTCVSIAPSKAVFQNTAVNIQTNSIVQDFFHRAFLDNNAYEIRQSLTN